jgi:hypothetical protein
MIDLNFFFKIFYMSANLIFGFIELIIVPIIIYLISKYINTSFCGDLILFYLINAIFLIPAMVLHCISIIFIVCDMYDLFGRGGFVSLIGMPVYILNICMGTYFKYLKKPTSQCINDSYNKEYLLGFMFNFTYFFSIFVFTTLISLVILRCYIAKYIIPKYKNTVYYEEQQKLLEEERLNEVEEKKKTDEKYELLINKRSMDPFKILDIDKANLEIIKN